MMISESEIYIRMKEFLSKKYNWVTLGGEPPDGTNTVPRIELKDVETKEKGSRGSKKIDLVFFKEGYFLLNELKSIFNQSDVNKLNEIVGDEKWRRAFIKALDEKRILEMNQIKINPDDYINSKRFLIKSITFSEGYKIPDEFVVFFVKEDGIEIRFGSGISDDVKKLFTRLS